MEKRDIVPSLVMRGSEKDEDEISVLVEREYCIHPKILFFLLCRMQTDLNGGPGLAVVAGDVLALRGTGLAAAETWALLCQAAQALQDLFLSSKSL